MNGVGLYATDTKFCRFCNAPIVMMCQRGRGYCCQNHEDADQCKPVDALFITGWDVPPHVS